MATKTSKIVSPKRKKLNFEYEKIKLERRRILLDAEGLRLEREKLAQDKTNGNWTRISIFFPILILAITLGVGIYEQSKQAKMDFEVKASDVVLSSSGPVEAQNKAKALVALFPSKLPNNFAESFNPTLYGGSNSTNGKLDLLTLIAEHPEQKAEIIIMWKELFPGDTWVDDLLK